jgi:hypothetical protein
MPNNTIFLVDTYDSLEGVEHAITVGRWLRERGTRGQVVLIDKGCHPVVDPQNLFGRPWEPRVTPEAIHADLAESLEPEQIELMKGLKRVFDPDNILNPGKIFD